MPRAEMAFVSGHDLQGDALTWVKPGSDSLAAGFFVCLDGGGSLTVNHVAS
jgi:hypothetical protein